MKNIRLQWKLFFLVWCVPASLIAQPAPKDGKEIYESYCAHCHGDQGDGKGFAFENTFPRPRDFTSNLFKIRTTPSGESPTQDDLYHIIRRGMPGTAMPPWEGVLTEEQLRSSAAYIERFYQGGGDESGDAEEEEKESEKGGEEDADAASEAEAGNAEEESGSENGEEESGESAGPLIIPPAIPSTAESIAKGEQLARKVECEKCHGLEGRGDGPSALEIKDDWNSEPIRPADWSASWRFRGGDRSEDIYRTIRTGLNGTPMPTFAEDLTEEETWHVVNYVRSKSPASEPEIKRTLVSKRTEEPITLDFENPLWDQAAEFYIPFSGQVMVNPRLFQPAIQALYLKSVYNDSEIAFLLRWNDPSSEKHQVMGGGDELMLQFPAKMKPGDTENPYFLMGQPGQSVNLWIWADQYGKAISAKASRLGEWSVLESRSIESNIRYKEGQYTLILKRKRVTNTKGEIQFPPDRVVIPIAFNAADGSHGEGKTKRAVTTWYHLLLEQPVGLNVYIMPVILFLLILGLETGLMMKTQRNRR